MSRVHYLEKGQGPTIVFLHGIGTDSEGFLLQLEFFADAGYRAVAWDMPGYGKTAPLDKITFLRLAELLHQLLDDLNVPSVHLVGHSIGGMIAQQFSRTGQNRLITMTLAQTSPAFGNKGGDFQKKFVADRLRPIQEGKSMADIVEEVLPGLIGTAPDPAGLSLARTCMGKVPSDSYVALVNCLVTFEGRDHLPLITVPTLVLAGEHDTNAPKVMMEKMSQKIPGAEFAVISGVGHLAPLEKPDTFNQVVLDFLARYNRNLIGQFGKGST